MAFPVPKWKFGQSLPYNMVAVIYICTRAYDTTIISAEN